VTFSPIAKSFKKNFDLNTFQVDLFSLIYMTVYPFVTPVSSYIIDNKSMRLGVFLIFI
jgi:fucose permease